MRARNTIMDDFDNPIADAPTKPKPTPKEGADTQPPEYVVEGNALGFLGADNPARQTIFRAMFHPAMDTFVMVLVITRAARSGVGMSVANLLSQRGRERSFDNKSGPKAFKT